MVDQQRRVELRDAIEQVVRDAVFEAAVFDRGTLRRLQRLDVHEDHHCPVFLVFAGRLHGADDDAGRIQRVGAALVDSTQLDLAPVVALPCQIFHDQPGDRLLHSRRLPKVARRFRVVADFQHEASIEVDDAGHLDQTHLERDGIPHGLGDFERAVQCWHRKGWMIGIDALSGEQGHGHLDGRADQG
ncbi:hypothetical protein D3C73_871400 [compost metagenome]